VHAAIVQSPANVYFCLAQHCGGTVFIKMNTKTGIEIQKRFAIANIEMTVVKLKGQ